MKLAIFPKILTPWHRAACALIAVAGTILFGAIASPDRADGIKLAIITGTSWIIFGLVLLCWSRLPFWHCFDACLATMVVGEAILILSALAGIPGPGILLANLAMAAFLATRLGGLGFRTWKTWTLWLGVLNGVALLLTPFVFA